MESDAAEIRKTIDDRDLTQWHLLIASLLGSLAQQGGVFNQALLNQMLTRSMRQFLIPFFEGLASAPTAKQRAGAASTAVEKLTVALEFLDEEFPLARETRVVPAEQPTRARVVVTGSGCRFCPIGVGKAQLDPSQTFCPFPTMLLEAAKFLLGDDSVKLCVTRERARTHVLTKAEGKCHIEFELAGGQ